jgi:oligopeptide transport system permease protein
MRKIFQNRMAAFGAAALVLIAGFVFAAPMVVSYGPDDANWEETNAGLSISHPFGTDAMGRDLLARVAYGAKLSFAVGLLASLISIIIGVAWGSVAGYSGGKTDYFMMRFVDIMYSLPFIFFVIIMIVVLGRNIYNLFLALGAVQWLTMSRMVRSEVLSLKKREFVEAARSLGLPGFKIIFKHIVPNLLGPVLAYGLLLIPVVMVEETFLSFLGLGVQPPHASLGTLINQGIGVVDLYWWQLFIPAGLLVLLLASLNFLGEGLKNVSR